ncbi:hypothetical protein GIB67_028151, partial [Kingdonia uniflora]
PRVDPVDEYGALAYAGSWGIHGILLPGRATFVPGNVGFVTYGVPHPLERYELGRSLGQGTFAKVYYTGNLKSRESVAVKLYEVMATKTKIYFVMEYAKGGELFNKVAKGKLKEDVTRRYLNFNSSSVQLIFATAENSVKLAFETKQEVARPSNLNAFYITSLSARFDLSCLFEEENKEKSEARFMSRQPGLNIIYNGGYCKVFEDENEKEIWGPTETGGIKRKKERIVVNCHCS